ncbi:hypothetical protein Tco_0257541 [Tanacetum coccineum]
MSLKDSQQEHSVATLRKENETLKQHYKDLYDSIKITRSKTTEQTRSLLANNAELKTQIQEKVFAIAALKNDLRKLKGNSVDTKFDKTSVLGKPGASQEVIVDFPLAQGKVDSKPPMLQMVDIPNNHACKTNYWIVKCRYIKQCSEGKSDLSAEVHQAVETVTTSNELDVLFGPLFDKYFKGENQVVLKSSAVTTTDASNKRQQQLD